MNASVPTPEYSSSSKDGYHFISDSHFSDGFKKMHHMQRHGMLCDVEISVGGETFRGHKLVFAFLSEYFSDLFCMEGTELCKHQIDDIGPEIFKILLQFFYTGGIKITSCVLRDIIKATRRFRIESLEKVCCDAVNRLLNPTIWYEINNLAGELEDERLLEKCHAYALEHFEEIAETESFLHLSFSDVKNIISDENLLVVSEETVYSAILAWVKHDSSNRKGDISELMGYVKLPLLDKKYLAREVVREPLIRENPECFRSVMEVNDYHMGVGTGEKLSRILPRKHYKEFLPYILVAGGEHEESVVNACEVYDPQTNTWHSFPSMQCTRVGTSLIGFKQQLYAFGGVGNTYTAVSSVEYCDPWKKCWTRIGSLPSPKWGSGVCSIDNTIYICGSRITKNLYASTVDKFDPETGVYVSSAEMNTKRGYFTPAVSDKCIYAIGGITDGAQALKSMEVFDPREGKWRNAPPMDSSRYHHGTAVLDGYIYIHPAGSSWERFNIRRNAWEPILNTYDEEGPFNRPGCIYLLSSSYDQIQFDTNNNAIFRLPQMKLEAWCRGITLMNSLKIKHEN